MNEDPCHSFTLSVYNLTQAQFPVSSSLFYLSYVPPSKLTSLPLSGLFLFLHPSFIIEPFLYWTSSLNAAAITTPLTVAPSLAVSHPSYVWRTPPPSFSLPPPPMLTLPAPTPPGWTPLSGAGPGCQALSCECGCCDFLWAIRWAAAN